MCTVRLFTREIFPHFKNEQRIGKTSLHEFPIFSTYIKLAKLLILSIIRNPLAKLLCSLRLTCGCFLQSVLNLLIM